MVAELDRHAHARAVLAPALAPGGRPSHAYLFHGPGGAGKRAAARAFAAELLAFDSADPESSRARAFSGAHPDLTWVAPSGAHEMLVSDIDGPVVSAATKTPFEGGRRVFVIERADELGDEAANRMLKTLEEPPSFVHLILLSDRLAEVLPTIRSRCQLVRFDAAPAEAIAATVQELGIAPRTALACAKLALGDGQQARELAGPEGLALRSAAEKFARATLGGDSARSKPWSDLIDAVQARGEAVRVELEARATAELELYPSKERKRIQTEWSERGRRVRRRIETAALDLGLQLVALWYEDLAAIAWDVPELVRHADRLEELRRAAAHAPQQLLAAVELVEDTRMRFLLNVSEELACEALAYRLEDVLGV